MACTDKDPLKQCVYKCSIDNCSSFTKADLKVHSQLLQQRLAWLQSGSKIPFGSVHEDRYILIIENIFNAKLINTIIMFSTLL